MRRVASPLGALVLVVGCVGDTAQVSAGAEGSTGTTGGASTGDATTTGVIGSSGEPESTSGCSVGEECGAWCASKPELLWCRSDFGLLPGSAGKAQVAVAADGSVVVAADYAPQSWGARGLVMALAPDGAVQWQASTELGFRTQDVAVLADGSIVVAGAYTNDLYRVPELHVFSGTGEPVGRVRGDGGSGSYFSVVALPDGGFVGVGGWGVGLQVERRDAALAVTWAQSLSIAEKLLPIHYTWTSVTRCGAVVVGIGFKSSNAAVRLDADGKFLGELTSEATEGPPWLAWNVALADEQVGFVSASFSNEGAAGINFWRVDPLTGEWAAPQLWASSSCCQVQSLVALPEESGESVVYMSIEGDSSYGKVRVERRSAAGAAQWATEVGEPAVTKVRGGELARSDVDATVVAVGSYDEHDAPLWVCKLAP